MVLADATVKPEELVKIYEIGHRHGISEDEFNQLLKIPVEFKSPDTLEKKIEFLYDLVLIIRADGVIDENEITSLKHYCIKFGFEEQNIDGIVDFLMKQASNNATIDEVLNEIKK
jgi:uncharacterized tellurite resistance protein B-like protein